MFETIKLKIKIKQFLKCLATDNHYITSFKIMSIEKATSDHYLNMLLERTYGNNSMSLTDRSLLFKNYINLLKANIKNLKVLVLYKEGAFTTSIYPLLYSFSSNNLTIVKGNEDIDILHKNDKKSIFPDSEFVFYNFDGKIKDVMFLKFEINSSDGMIIHNSYQNKTFFNYIELAIKKDNEQYESIMYYNNKLIKNFKHPIIKNPTFNDILKEALYPFNIKNGFYKEINKKPVYTKEFVDSMNEYKDLSDIYSI